MASDILGKPYPGILSMQIHSRHVGEANIVAPKGRIDHANSEAFHAALAPHVDECSSAGNLLVFDMAGVDYISSAGLRCFMLAAKQARTQGGTIVIAAMQPIVREIFEISRFTLLFESFASVREAVATVAPDALADLDPR
jgi:anti-anti-sigma factor